MLVRLAGGLVLAAAAAAAVFVATGGAGDDGRAGGLVLLAVLAVGALLVLIVPAIGVRAPRATPGLRGWTSRAGTGPSPPVSRPAAPEPQRWSRPAAAAGPRWPEARSGARATTGRPAGGGAASARLRVAAFGLGIAAVLVMILAFAALWHDDLPDAEQSTVYLVTALLTGIPCLLAGFIAGRRRAGLELATWMEHMAGIVAGTVGITIVDVVTVDPTGEGAPYLFVGLLILAVPVSTVAFVIGLAVWRMAAGSRRPAGIPGVRG